MKKQFREAIDTHLPTDVANCIPQVQEIFCEDYGMFVYDDATRTFWFNSLSLEPSENFQLCGIILGLAIYNNVILDVHFPIAVYKLLLGLELDYHDLEALMPDLAKGLQQMLDFEGDVESVFCTAFEVCNILGIIMLRPLHSTLCSMIVVYLK